MFKNLIQRATLALLLFLASCNSVAKRQWEFDEDIRCCEGYTSAKMFVRPENDFNGLELEFVCTEQDARMYLNIRSIPISNAEVEILYSIDGAVEKAHAYCLKGGQRILVPENISNKIISALLENKTVYISVGRYRSEITPNEFCRHFKKMSHFMV